jgi:hypothetical protein
VELRFTASPSVKSSAALRDPLRGVVYGSIFLQEDVAVDGPREGAQHFAAVELQVDLTTTTTSAEAFVTTLPPGSYVFIGFLDVDGNGSEQKRPDAGDPVTLALTNKFELTDGAERRKAVVFELVLN